MIINIMTYFEILPSDIILHIIDKLTIEGIHHFTNVVDVDNHQFRWLYSLNFKYIYDNYSHVFSLDTLITWKDHYIQMFKVHNLIKCYKESLFLYDDGTVVLNMRSHETTYVVDKLVLSSLPSGIPDEVDTVLHIRLQFHIPDYYIMIMMNLLKDKDLKDLGRSSRSSLFYIWIYSKTYAEYILNQIDFTIYRYTYDSMCSVSDETYYVIIYQDLTGCNKRGPEKLRFIDVKDIISSRRPDLIYSKYNMSGLYLKYLLEHHPNNIKL